jgi:hypothetical protein
MQHLPIGGISRDRQSSFLRAVWVAAVTLLAVALAGAIVVAVHYRSEVATLRRQLLTAAGHHRGRVGPVTLSSTTVKLPSRGTLHGGVTVFSAKSASGLTRIVLSVHLRGGRPHTQYALLAFDCTGSSGYQVWAAGGTNAHGSATLSGHAQTVSPSDQYWLYVSPSSSGGSSEAGLRGDFRAAGKFSASPAGNPACPLTKTFSADPFRPVQRARRVPPSDGSWW